MPITDSMRKNNEYNVLLVDDEKNVLSSLKRLFRKEPYNLILATSAEEGIDKLSEDGAQVIISDFRMPGKNGVEFLKESKKICPECIRMVLSGYADISAIIDAVNEGDIYKFLTKPWNDDELKITLKRAMEQYELKKENRALTRELKTLNKSLEEKVEERTKELQLRNKALLFSQEVMELLPFAVIGVDVESIVTLVNEKAAKLLPEGKYSLGEKAQDSLPSGIVEFIEDDNSREKNKKVNINDREYVVRLSPLGLKDNARGHILTMYEEST